MCRKKKQIRFTLYPLFTGPLFVPVVIDKKNKSWFLIIILQNVGSIYRELCPQY